VDSGRGLEGGGDAVMQRQSEFEKGVVAESGREGGSRRLENGVVRRRV